MPPAAPMPLGGWKWAGDVSPGNVHHVAVDPVQAVVRFARVVVKPRERQPAKGVEIGIATAGRVGQVAQPANGRDVADAPLDVLHRQASAPAADAESLFAADDEVIALHGRFP